MVMLIYDLFINADMTGIPCASRALLQNPYIFSALSQLNTSLFSVACAHIPRMPLCTGRAA